MEKYIILHKNVGETPLSCAEDYRQNHPGLTGVPMAYAGRLDPMASGKLLILLGDECKNQASYHNLDKEYEFSVLLGIESDSLDVLGRLNTCYREKDEVTTEIISAVADKFVGAIELPYPKFSAKTVKGKPLHMWTLENRLDEIEIPTKQSTVYSLEITKIQTINRAEMVTQALTKVNSIPEVTDERKALGNDFRRVDVRNDWENIRNVSSLPNNFQIAHFTCTASSGTYMRTLASLLAKELNTCGLAWSINRTKIGRYQADLKIWNMEY